MSGKRQGDNLDQDNWRDASIEGGEDPGTWQKADEATLRERKMRRAKRPPPSSGSLLAGSVIAAGPSAANPFANVQLVAPSTAPAAGSTFSFGAAAPATAPAPAPAAFSFGAFSSNSAAPAGTPTAPAPSSAPTFSFGSSFSSSPANDAGFAFGTPSQAPAPTTSFPKFAFGSNATSTQTPEGASGAPKLSNPGFSFGPPTTAKPSPFGAAFGQSSGSIEVVTNGISLETQAPTPAPLLNVGGSASTTSNGAPSAFKFGTAGAQSNGTEAPTGVFNFGAAASSPPAPLPASAVGGAPTVDGKSSDAFNFGSALSAPMSGSTKLSASASKTPSQQAVFNGETRNQLEQLNADLKSWLEEELREGGAAADWSDGLRDYIQQRKAITSGQSPAETKSASVSTPSASVVAASSTPAAPLSTSAPASDAALAPSGGEKGDATEIWKAMCKLSVYRTAKKNEEGELIQEKGWKPVGKGLLKLLKQDAVHFLEFRPLVSESANAGNDPEDEVSNKRERYGRAVVSARLLSSTKFDVVKKAVLTNLWSNNASGQPTFSRYNIPLGSEEMATEFAELARKCAEQSASS